MAISKEDAIKAHNDLIDSMFQACIYAIDEQLRWHPAGSSIEFHARTKSGSASIVANIVPDLAPRIKEAYTKAGWKVGAVSVSYGSSYDVLNIVIKGIE